MNKRESFARALREMTWLSLVVVAAFGFMAVPSAGRAMTRLALPATGLGRLGDDMGSTLALEGDTVLVGAPGTYVSLLYSQGTALVYRNIGGSWQLEASLTPTEVSPNMGFGGAVALGADLAVVGSVWMPTLTTFERSGTTWTEVNSFEANVSPVISISGDTLGSAGMIYVRDGSGWQVQANLQTLIGDSPYTLTDVVVDGDLAVAAGYGRDGTDAAFFFSRNAGVWTNEGAAGVGAGWLDPFVRVALSGNTALVGNNRLYAGADVGVYVRDPATGSWNDNGILDTGTDLFNAWYEVAIEGDEAIIGSGADAYTFTRTGTTWTRTSHFLDPLGQGCFQRIAFDASVILGGCPDTVTPSGGYGTVKIFERNADPPPVVASFDQGNANVGSGFGTAVAYSGTVIVAASYLGTSVFEQQNGNWVQQTMIPLHDGLYADALSIDGATFAAGYARFGVGIYARTDGAWTEQAFLPAFTSEIASRSPGPSGFTQFGAAIALNGDTLVVGDPIPTEGGRCDLYTQAGAGWSQSAVLVPNDSTGNDKFGAAAVLANDTIVVGAPDADTGIETDSGAVYVFVPSGTGWAQRARVVAPVVAAGAQFGGAVALGGDVLVVGAVNASGTRGNAYVYRRSGDIWSFEADLTTLAGDVDGSFGSKVAISTDGATAYVSAPVGPIGKGLVYAFGFDGASWSLMSTIQGIAPPPPDMPPDCFGCSISAEGGSLAIGARNDLAIGSVYFGSLSPVIFADGFDSP